MHSGGDAVRNEVPFHPLNAGFIASAWACAHASLLSSPDIDCRTVRASRQTKTRKAINDILKSW